LPALLRFYGLGEVAGDSVVVGGVVAIVASGLIAVVASGEAADGDTVSVFCSQAASRAALARMQMYLFIMVVEKGILGQLSIGSKCPFSDLLGAEPD
jgi:hypothetical protein